MRIMESSAPLCTLLVVATRNKSTACGVHMTWRSIHRHYEGAATCDHVGLILIGNNVIITRFFLVTDPSGMRRGPRSLVFSPYRLIRTSGKQTHYNIARPSLYAASTRKKITWTATCQYVYKRDQVIYGLAICLILQKQDILWILLKTIKHTLWGHDRQEDTIQQVPVFSRYPSSGIVSLKLDYFLWLAQRAFAFQGERKKISIIIYIYIVIEGSHIIKELSNRVSCIIGVMKSTMLSLAAL